MPILVALVMFALQAQEWLLLKALKELTAQQVIIVQKEILAKWTVLLEPTSLHLGSLLASIALLVLFVQQLV